MASNGVKDWPTAAGGGNLLVKPVHELMELAAHTAHQPVAEARQLAQYHCRTRLNLPVGLPECQKNNGSLSHGR